MTLSHKIEFLLRIKTGELTAVLWSFVYFFCVLASYYILRPLREEMGVASGVDKLQWLFTAVFVVMLVIVPVYGWITSHFARRKFVPWVYVFFICNLLAFYVVFRVTGRALWVERLFFVWVSVFNLFVVSVFWSFMTDIFNTDQAERLFGIIAAGGSAGAITGPVLTASLVKTIGVDALLLISGVVLMGAVVSIGRLIAWMEKSETAVRHVTKSQPIGGSIIAGARLVLRSRFLFLIAVYTILATMSGSILYLQQADIISRVLDVPEQRTQLFALVDLSVNILTVLIQVFLTGRIVKAFGIANAIRFLPILVFLGMVILGFSPVLGVVLVVQVLRRAMAFSIAVPTVNTLFTVVTLEERYKAKHFIDTVMYRLGDVTSSWLFSFLKASGYNLGFVAMFGALFGLIWTAVALVLGREFLWRRSKERIKSI